MGSQMTTQFQDPSKDDIAVICYTSGQYNESDTAISFILHSMRLVKLDYFVKFDREITVDQQAKACDQTFDGVSDLKHNWHARGSHAHFDPKNKIFQI